MPNCTIVVNARMRALAISCMTKRLVILSYPVPSNATTEILARDALLETLYDRELSLKVREKESRSMDVAYRTPNRG